MKADFPSTMTRLAAPHLNTGEQILWGLRVRQSGGARQQGGAIAGGMVGAAVANGIGSHRRTVLANLGLPPIASMSFALTETRILVFTNCIAATRMSSKGNLPVGYRSAIHLSSVDSVALAGPRGYRRLRITFRNGTKARLDCKRADRPDQFVEIVSGLISRRTHQHLVPPPPPSAAPRVR